MPDARTASSMRPPTARRPADAEPAERHGSAAVLRWLPVLVVLAAGGVWLLVRAHWYSSWTDDDAFISFRYARNLATGNGLVYNIGERTEGYTNFLWTVLLAALYHVNTDLPQVARWLGCLLALVTPALVFLGTTRLGALQPPASLPASARLFLAGLAPLLLLGSDAWAAWAVGGLESVGSAFLVAAAYLVYLRSLEPRAIGKTLVGTALLLVLATHNHPSNLLFAFPIVAHALWRLRRDELQPRDVWLPAGLAIGVLGAWEVWRLVYYGDWLPNTYHAKVGFTPYVLQRGLRFLLVVLKALPVMAAAVVALVVCLAATRQWRHPGWLLVAAAFLHTPYVLVIGGEEFPALRVFVVLLPLLALVVQMLANQLCAWALPQSAVVRAGIAVAVVAALTVLHASFLYASPRLRVLDQPVRTHRTALSRAAAMQLKAKLPAETVFAHSGAGLLAYYTNFRWIDTLGLTDRTIARRHLDTMGKGAAGHEKGDGAYVWSRQPDYVMFPGFPISDVKPSTRGDLELFAIPEFQKTYHSVRFPFEFQGPMDDVPRQYLLFLWERVDRAAGH